MQWPKRSCSIRSNISQPEFINRPAGDFRDDKFRAGTNDAQRRIEMSNTAIKQKLFTLILDLDVGCIDATGRCPDRGVGGWTFS